jgi:hypothetical protein
MCGFIALVCCLFFVSFVFVFHVNFFVFINRNALIFCVLTQIFTTYTLGWIDEIEKSIYQIAWGLKSLVLIQLSQIQSIFRSPLEADHKSWKFLEKILEH